MAISAARVASRRFANVFFVGFCGLVTIVALTALALILYSLVTQGMAGMNLDIFTKSTPAAGTPGGLINAIVGSIMMSVLGMVIALAVGILAGTWLAEYAGSSPYGGVVRFLNDVLLSAPSILVGLFVYQMLVANVFHHFSGIAGAVALGTPVWQVIRQVLWRAAQSGILTGGLLAFARISGETAPLLFTGLNNQFFSWDMTHAMANLPVVIFQDAMTPYADLNRLAWAGALLIAAAVLTVTILARAFSREQKRS